MTEPVSPAFARSLLSLDRDFDIGLAHSRLQEKCQHAPQLPPEPTLETSDILQLSTRRVTGRLNPGALNFITKPSP